MATEVKALALKVLQRHASSLTPASTGEIENGARRLPETAPDPIWTPPLGRRNDRGEMTLTGADLPELERRLQLSGWRVTRRGNELTCISRGALRIQ